MEAFLDTGELVGDLLAALIAHYFLVVAAERQDALAAPVLDEARAGP